MNFSRTIMDAIMDGVISGKQLWKTSYLMTTTPEIQEERSIRTDAI